MRKALTSIAFACLLATSTVTAQRFAVFSDIHVTPGNENDKMLRIAVDEVNRGGFDYVIINGDLTNEGSDDEINNVKEILDGITDTPLIVLPGNHENNWSQSATKTFIDVFGNDRFVFETDSLIVVGINCGPYMKMGDGHIKQEDLHWLRKTLDERVSSGKKVLSFNHYPIRQDDLDNWREYAEVLMGYPVIGHINGHYHRWIRYDVGDLECAMIRALKMNDGFGYTIVEVEPAWTHIYNKVIGSPAEAKYAFANHTKHQPLKKEVVDDVQLPSGFEVVKVWTDSASVFTRLAFDENNVYFGNSLGQARAVNKKTGQMTWEVKTPASLFSRPVILEKGKVAVPTCDAILLVDAKTGQIKDNIQSKEGPYVADGLYQDGIYVQGGYKRMERRNPINGILIWEYDSLFNYCQAAPVIDGKDLIFGAWDTNLRCIDINTGKLKWVWNNGKSANMLGPGNVVPVVTEDKVIIVAPDRYMTAIDRKNGQQIWRDNSHKYREAIGVSEDRTRVYAKTMDGELVAVSTKGDAFNELWTVDMGLGYEHAPCIVVEKDGVVYAGSRRGIITAVDPYEQKVLWSLPVGVSEINGIDIDPTTGDIYASLIEGTIFRIERK
ncbi:MAG: PQQ-binding-like beta-propeller repeat protein [Muribaculaceae bacterium]|nr:PQQ-binding-like beta-propeller repeat protein [Muribaculaceae bacterium]